MTTQLFGFLSTDPSLDKFALPILRSGLSVPPLASSLRHALGTGWVDQGKGVVRRRPGAGNRPRDLAGILLDTPGRAVVGMLLGSEERFDPGSVPPYRARRWVYAVQLVESIPPGIEQVEAQAMPQALASQRQCRTLTERRFLPLIHALISVPGTGSRSSTEDAMRDAAVAALDTMATAGRQACDDGDAVRPPLDVIATDGEVLVVASDSDNFVWTDRTGLSDADLVDEDALRLDRPGHRPDYRAVVVRQGIPCPEGWNALEPGQLLFVRRDLQTEVVRWRGKGEPSTGSSPLNSQGQRSSDLQGLD